MRLCLNTNQTTLGDSNGRQSGEAEGGRWQGQWCGAELLERISTPRDCSKDWVGCSVSTATPYFLVGYFLGECITSGFQGIISKHSFYRMFGNASWEKEHGKLLCGCSIKLGSTGFCGTLNQSHSVNSYRNTHFIIRKILHTRVKKPLNIKWIGERQSVHSE